MEGAKSFERRDRLIEIQNSAQKFWAENKTHESTLDTTRPKFLITFPIPYMNGRMHLGHAFSITKAEFFARYKRIRGFNVLFPFAFHCTGMPICAAANKLKKELDAGIDYINTYMTNRKTITDPKKTPAMLQYEILRSVNVDEEEIPKFVDPLYWLKYFPPRNLSDMQGLGLACDWRRSFITTEVNPYYDAFVRWQFDTLKKKGFVKFGKRPSIFCIEDKQMCADHDRATGEGVGPQDYTIIKMKVNDLSKPCFEKIREMKVFFMAATLRPETMYGQTNCYVLPEGVYGAYESRNGEIWICAERAAKNMAYQELQKVDNEWESLCSIKGEDIIGVPMVSPLCSYNQIYMWPMLSISMEKGTGIVTSVPSDSPDDYANLQMLKDKPDWRAKWGLTDEMVLPFEPISIIDIPGFGDMCAKQVCEEKKIKSPNDKIKLAEAKEVCYQKGFYEGLMKVGDFKGEKVESAKLKVRKWMIENNHAAGYFEPLEPIMSRSGYDCIVALCDQWYLDYGNAKYKKIVLDHVKSDNFDSFNDGIQQAFEGAIDWLKEWGCSRSFGLGTKVPFDEKYLVESLSDSTIYMAYYTISNFLQGDLEGSIPGELGIKAGEMQNYDFDYVFLNKDYNPESKIAEEKLKTMRESFRYWYPMDFRTSGKDLIKNHLTMSLYSHSVIWDEEGTDMVPRSIFANGWVLIDGEKMSKQKGNFFTCVDITNKFGSDATRVAMCSAGDTMNDANIVQSDIDKSILRLGALETWITENIKSLGNMRTESNAEIEFYDQVFENELNKTVQEYCENFDKLVLRDVVISCLFNMGHMRDNYRLNVGTFGYKRDLVERYIELQLLLLFPIAPHFSEIMWKDIFIPNLPVESRSKYAATCSGSTLGDLKTLKVDIVVLKHWKFLTRLASFMATAHVKEQNKGNKKGKGTKKEFSIVHLVVANFYRDWQVTIQEILKKAEYNDKKEVISDYKAKIKEAITDKKLMKNAFAFATECLDGYKLVGDEALDSTFPINQIGLIESNKAYLIRDLDKVKELIIVNAQEKIDCPIMEKQAGDSMPGNPCFHFVE